MKTLGIKFEVVGVKSATDTLDKLRSNINFTVTQSKKDVERGWRNWKIENFGTTAQKQNLVIRQEKQDFRERSTYKQLNQNNKALVLEFRLAYREFFVQLKSILEELKPEKSGITDFLGGLILNPLKFALDAVLFPFQAAVSGAFERLGEVQVQDFAEGFQKSLQRSLGLSFEETGSDVGKIIGISLYKIYQKSVNATNDYVKGNLKFNLADTVIEAFSYTIKTLVKELPALALRTHRRIQLNKNAIPEARKLAGIKMVENDLPESTRKDIENNKSITLVYGGANTDRADIGKDYTAQIMKNYLKGTAVIPLTRQWTNSAVDSEFQGDIKNIIKLILSNPLTSQAFKGFINENGMDSLSKREKEGLLESFDLEGGIDLSDINRVAEIIQDLVENKDFALGKALEATFKGYNPDDVLGAAEAIALMEMFPDKELQIGGFSHGGYNALGTVDLLNRAGYTKVKGFSIGTPITGANATINPDNFKAFMGDMDYYYKVLTGIAGEDIDFPEFFEVGKDQGAKHSLQGYVKHEGVRGGLQAFLGDRLSIPSKDKYGKHDSAYGYGVGELGAQTALIRTLLTYLGESELGSVRAKDGFIFSSEETLPGYIANIEKLSQGLKDEDTKQFHAKYIDFLKTLQSEIATAEEFAIIGKKYKPIESLKKAASIFPETEKLASLHTAQNFNQEEEALYKDEIKQKEKFVFFNKKTKQQKDNIERTFQAMLGREFSESDENKGIYSFYNSKEYQQRASNFEGMVNWLENDILGEASIEEKEQAKPLLDLLKKITNNIRTVGDTGELDLEVVREAEKLLRIDLREFNLLFKQLESSGNKNINVAKYKNELRVFRRNRDQILNEKKTPLVVRQALESSKNRGLTESHVAPTEKTLPQRGDGSPQENPSLARTAEDTARAIVDNYNKHLKNIIAEAGKSDTSGINEEAQFNLIKQQIKEYRRAVKQGLFNEAKEAGESILKSSEQLKQVFNKSGDKRVGQLTRIQNEILVGDSGLGRSPTPLAEVFYKNDEVQLQLDLWQDTSDGARTSLNRETGQEIGGEFAQGIIEGAQEKLDIQSPSRVFQWIGEMIKAGFNNGVSGIADHIQGSMQAVADGVVSASLGAVDVVSNMAAELNGSAGLLDPLLQVEGADEEVNNFFANLITTAGDTFGKLSEQFPIIGRVGEMVTSIGGELLQAFGLFGVGDFLIQFTSSALNAAMSMESLEESIKSVSSSSQSAQDNIKFLKEEAQNLSIDLLTAGDSYKRLLGATQNTPLEGVMTQKLFSTLATTARNRGMNSDATSRLFMGFEQVIAKGEFRSEEVRGQLSEVVGDIQNLLATAVGVPVNQLDEMMAAGNLKAPEVMPKLMALFDAQNAATGKGSGTAFQAQARLNNAIFEYQAAVGKQLQPVQKLGLDSLASSLEKLKENATLIIKLVTALIATVLTNLALKLLSTKIALNGLVVVLGQFVGILTSAAFLSFVSRFALMALAIESVTAAVRVLKNAFPELQDRIENATKRLEALNKAFEDTGNKQKVIDESKPSQMQLDQGAEVPEWLQGIAGGERFNLDNFFRNRYQRFRDRQNQQYIDFLKERGNSEEADRFSKEAKSSRFVTYAQKRQADFVIGASDLVDINNQTLTKGDAAKKVLEQIANLDTKTRDLQSQRLNLSSGDTEGLRASLSKEKEIFAQRDDLLKQSSQYQESLKGGIEDVNAALLILSSFNNTGGTKEEIEQRAKLKQSLEQQLKLLEAEEKAIADINSRLPKFISSVQKLVKASDLNVAGFIAGQEDEARSTRTETINEAIKEGLSDQELQVKLNDNSEKDLKDRIEFVKGEIKTLEKKLNSSYLQEGVKGLKRAAESDGLKFTSNVIEELVGSGSRNSQETEAGNVLLKLDEYEGIIAESEASLTDLLRENQTKFKDLTNTFDDYFFRLNQQIQEAQIEIQKITNQIIQTQIRNKLQTALSPNSESFVNQLISSTQSLLDQAASYAEKLLGQQSARIQFASTKRSLQMELQDFARNVNGASSALVEFENRLRGGAVSSDASPSFQKDGASVTAFRGSNINDLGSGNSGKNNTITALRRAIIGNESNGNYQAVNPDSGALGYGQVMPANVPSWTKAALGKSLTSDQFLADPNAQIKTIDYKLLEYLQKELSQGFDVDTAIRRVASTWYSGQPKLYNSTSRQYYNNREYPSIDSYTKDILSRFKAEGGGQVPFSSVLNVPSLPTFTSSGTLPPPQDDREDRSEQATQLTDNAIAIEEQKLNLQDSLVSNQEKVSLRIALDNTSKSDRRKTENEIKERQFQMDDSIYSRLDLIAQYNYQAADKEAESAIRSVNKAFSDRGREVRRQIQFYQDEITSIEKLLNSISKLLSSAQSDEQREAIHEQKANAKLLLPVYKGNLAQLIEQEKELAKYAETALGFVREQNKLKIEASKLNKANALLTAQELISQSQGSVKVQEQLRLKIEENRLQSKINEIKTNNAPGKYRNQLIKLEREQSKVNRSNIKFDAQNSALDLERSIIELNSNIDDKKAEFYNRIGFNFKGDKLKRDNARAQENIRYQKELLQLQKQFAAYPEKLAYLKAQAIELNKVNLEAIRLQFKSLGTTLEDLSISAIQGFFKDITTGLFDGRAQQEKSLLDERLRYAEELVQLEDQYREEPGKLAHLKNRARELNEQKLDNIKNEFNLFSRVVGVAGQALLEFGKQLAAIAAQYAAAKFISSIFKTGVGAVGGVIEQGNDFGSMPGLAPFVADEGATVGDRKISTRATNYLRKIDPSVEVAWRAEGKNAQLGVFHTGEELLSRKTGEASRYQALKYRYGSDPLKRILNYSEGGTIGMSNVISTISFPRTRIDLSGLKQNNTQSLPQKTVNINTTVVTPNADSFRLNQDQLNQDLMERMRRGF